MKRKQHDQSMDCSDNIVNRTLLLCSCLLAFICAPAHSHANELEMKAALVFKLTRFITWPDEAEDTGVKTLTICSFTRDPINPYLNALRGKTSHGRKINIQHIDHIKQAKQACRILYVSREQTFENIYKLRRKALLTISDKVGFAKRGGMIEIARRNDRLRFHINHANAVAAGIKISAPLLNISTIINHHDIGGTK